MLLSVSHTLYDLIRYGEIKFIYMQGDKKRGKTISEIQWIDHRPQELREKHW
jgi:hypothetical protein